MSDCTRTGVRWTDVRLCKDRHQADGEVSDCTDRQMEKCQTVQTGIRWMEMSDCAKTGARWTDVRLCKDRHQVDGEMSDCAKTGVRQMERCQTVKDKRQVDGRDFFWVVVEVVGSSLSLGGAVLGCAPCDMCSPMACCSSLFSQLHNPVVFLFFLEYGQFCLRIQRLNSL